MNFSYVKEKDDTVNFKYRLHKLNKNILLLCVFYYLLFKTTQNPKASRKKKTNESSLKN